MAPSYLKNSASTRSTPQGQPIPGSGQVPNSAGGYAWTVPPLDRLRRFLILGSEGGSYYASQHKLTLENVAAVRDALDSEGTKAVDAIVEISQGGRAPKQEPTLYALAMAAGHTNDGVRKAALDAVPKVCRTGTMLFQFIDFAEEFRGHGRAFNRVLKEWYTREDVAQVAYQAVKYRQRGGRTHRDVLRLAKPVPPTSLHNELFGWIAKGESFSVTSSLDRALSAHKDGYESTPIGEDAPLGILLGYELAQRAETPKDTAELVRRYKLPREALTTEHLNSPEVWEAMLYEGGKWGMPITALIRNLATMTRVGLLTPTADATRKVIEMVTAENLLKHARVHPLTVLMAARTYAAGHGLRGKNTWAPLAPIVDALDEAFYLAFANVEPTGKKRLIALDISSSMWGRSVAGIPGFTPAEAAGAMALVSMKSGDPYEVVAFTAARSYYRAAEAPTEVIPGLSAHALSARQRLDDVLKYMRELSRYMGGTDAALPMLYANSADRDVDVFEVFTDSETWAGSPHPAQALSQYRANRAKPEAKLIVYGMVSNGFSIADPNDPGMLDIVGFDANAPAIAQEFVQGNL